MFKYKVLGANLLVKPDELETKTKSGIILTEESSDKPRWGTVVALGDAEGRKDIMTGIDFHFSVKVGDHVSWIGYGREIELDGIKYLVFRNEDLIIVE
jgi:chaperonin GroES